MKHIVLIGFMGAGKSTVGRALAAELGRELLDTDQMIEEKAGCRITEIFARQGEPAFRRLEEEILKQLAEEKAPAVISTGGGMPVFEKNRPALRRLGTVVYLQVKPETVLKRLKGDTTRPLLQGGGAESRVRELLAEREPAYRDTAHEVVPVDGMSADEVVRRIKELNKV